MRRDERLDFYHFKDESNSVTNPIIFSSIKSFSGHIYTTNRNTILADDVDEILHKLIDFSDSTIERSKFCFSQTGAIWGGSGISSFIRQLNNRHSRYVESPHHRGEATWIAPAARNGISYVIFSGQPKRRKSFIGNAKAGIVTNSEMDINLDLESDRVSFNKGDIEHRKFDSESYTMIDEPKSDTVTRYQKTINTYDGLCEIICSNPYHQQPTELAQDLVGFENISKKHNIIKMISNLENLRGYRPVDEEPIFKLDSLTVSSLPSISFTPTYNIYAEIRSKFK